MSWKRRQKMANCYFCYNEVEENRGYHKKCCKKFFGTDKLPEFKLDQQMLQNLAEETVNKRIAVTGVQPKLSLDLENIPAGKRLTIVGLQGKYILKPQNAEIAFMPEVEDLTMHLAEIFKIKTCDHCLIPISDGGPAYVAKRFDRKGKAKIHMEDFCQLGGFQTEQKYDSSYERCGKLINLYCTNKGLDVLNYFELLVFSFLSGNSDMHMKNFSILYSGDQIILSPAYDLINSSLIFPDDKDDVALFLSGRKRNIKRKDFENLAVSIGLSDKVCQRVISKFVNTPHSFFDTIHRSFLHEEHKEEYIRIWLSRANRLIS
ncbi:HipA domain-containing protein [Pedobacter metabolipauper]|uniref:Serine/threonine-protein kinase HipA n=1 Tax=Pedobacter metabolipauper TaxID=425513 RepID=A0A4V3D0U1_9SPHI|nr:HipA domain-containing protein [Pedobacter metabolipauper]TDQ07489.1 serine/threonine-protein kinase HipA [Pedobacter metabolipauper]